MKLSISNIGWAEENDAAFYSMMKKHGFMGLEIAPTRIERFMILSMLLKEHNVQWS